VACFVVENGVNDIDVIGSDIPWREYFLQVMEEEIHNDALNSMRFVSLSKPNNRKNSFTLPRLKMTMAFSLNEGTTYLFKVTDD
jgi:prephenate dehydratase